jgi:hypothetical protein
VGEPENRRQREAMLATMAPVVDEEVVCAESARLHRPPGECDDAGAAKEADRRLAADPGRPEVPRAQGGVVFNATGSTYTSKIVRATLTFDGDERPLVIDFPDTPLARELMQAAKAAIEAAH